MVENSSDLWSPIFHALPDIIHVLPTENYYYFQLLDGVRRHRGSINLYADRLDEGVIGLNIEGGTPSRYRQIGSTDGMALRRLSPLVYSIRYQDVTKRIELNPIVLEQRTSRLPPRHQHVGRISDESGLRFELAFDPAARHLYWLLDEQTAWAGRFVAVMDRVFADPLSGFVFYQTKSQPRFVLIGVKRSQVVSNGLCDGPFDQLPDMAVLESGLDLSSFIVAEFPTYAGRIDRFGIFTSDRSERVALDAYRIYDDLNRFRDMIRRVLDTYAGDDDRISRLTRRTSWAAF